MRIGLLIEASTHLVLALTRSSLVAGATLALFGFHAMIWSVVSVSLRQELIPGRLLGRVNSAYAVFSYGGSSLGALLGGLLAGRFGLTAPFWCGFVAVDIEGFGRQERDDPGRIGMREALFAVLADGLKLAGIERGQWEQSDLGDGILVLISPEVSKVRLIDPLIGELTFALQRYNDTAGPAARMRLRAVVHAGEVVRHKQTYVGNDLNYAFRLLDSGTLRRCLADSTTDLALMVSDPIYQSVVRHGWGRIRVTSYRQVLVTAKDVKAHAWVHVPEAVPAEATPPGSGSGPSGSGPSGSGPSGSGAGPDNPSRRVSNLPPRNSRFTGRDEPLALIAQSLIGDQAAAPDRKSVV